MTPAPALQFDVLEDEDGLRLDRFLALRLPEESRTRLAGWIKAGLATVDGAQVRPSQSVLVGQCVTLQKPPPRSVDLVPQAMELNFVFQDEHLVVVHKPPGLVVHPGAGHADGTLVNGLLAALGRLSPVGLPERPGVVHRIDAGTSGLLVFALTELAHLHLARQFSEHTVDRRYRSIVWDHGLDDEGTIETCYGRHPKDRRKFTGQCLDGKRAVTHWKVLERLPPCALVELRLETGRTHQIRVHMSEAGHPLVGDATYGRKRRVDRIPGLRHLGLELGLKRQALHAARLGFIHPMSGERMRFEAPLTNDLQTILDVLRKVV